MQHGFQATVQNIRAATVDKGGMTIAQYVLILRNVV
jgi:hypothetical protein